MPEDAVTYWQDKLAELVETPAWKDVEETNQWEPKYLTGAEMDDYLDQANSDIEDGLESTGGVGRSHVCR